MPAEQLARHPERLNVEFSLRPTLSFITIIQSLFSFILHLQVHIRFLHSILKHILFSLLARV